VLPGAGAGLGVLLLLLLLLLLLRGHLARQAAPRGGAAGRLLDLEQELRQRDWWLLLCPQARAAAASLLRLLPLLALRRVVRCLAGGSFMPPLVELQEHLRAPPAGCLAGIRRAPAALEDGGGGADADRDDCGPNEFLSAGSCSWQLQRPGWRVAVAMPTPRGFDGASEAGS
jgi:hypothetical protein